MVSPKIFLQHVWALGMTERSYKAFNTLDPVVQQRIVDYFEKNILKQKNPRCFGKKLQGNLKDFWSYRIQDYRIIAKIEDKKFLIMAVEVAHRRHVYDFSPR